MSKRAEQKAKEYEKSLDYYHYTSDNPSVAYQEGYEQAENDIWAAIGNYLSKRDTRDYSTVGWILKHLDEYKKAIMEDE